MLRPDHLVAEGLCRLAREVQGPFGLAREEQASGAAHRLTRLVG